MSTETNTSPITLLPFNQQKKGRNVTLADLFSAYLTSSKLEVHVTDLTLILQTDFNVEINKLKKDVVNVLSEAFFNYYKIWPGWERKQEYLNGNILYSVWYRQFTEYLSYKCKATIDFAESYLKKNTKQTSTISTQTIQTGDIKDCPYKLIVGSHPTIINNIAFITRDEHIFIKQHPIKPWNPLSVVEFLNWPFVTAELNLLDIHIKRANLHNFTRYVTIDKIELNVADSNFITQITKHADTAQPFKYRFFAFYFKQLFTILGKIKTINPDHLLQIQILCEQFLEDIKEMNIHNGSMQSFTTVNFHIGNFKYFRQKQIVTSQKDSLQVNKNVINLLEIITPELASTLVEFSAVQDFTNTDSVTFKTLNNINKLIETAADDEISRFVKNLHENSLTYRCSFCKVVCSGSSGLTNITAHFAESHKVGHAVMCHLCGKEFEVQQLSKQRWSHKCI